MRQPNDDPCSGWHPFSVRLAVEFVWAALVAALLSITPAAASDKIDTKHESDAAPLTAQDLTAPEGDQQRAKLANGVVDVRGGQETNEEERLTVDITVTSPEDGAQYVNGAINITAIASGKVASIVLYGDANELQTCAQTTSCSTVWQSRRLARGGHTASATVTDIAGRQENDAVTIHVTSWRREGVSAQARTRADNKLTVEAR